MVRHHRITRSIAILILIASFLSPIEAFAYPKFLYTPTSVAPLGSVLTIFGQDLTNANNFSISPASPPPNFTLPYSIPITEKISDTEIRLTLPTFEMLQPYLFYDFGFGLTAITPDRSYSINIYDRSSTAEIITLELYRAEPYVDGNGKIPCSVNGYVTVSSNIVTSNSSCKGTLTLPSGVTEIGADAFYSNTHITQVNFPATLTKINTQAFIGATGLNSITLPENLLTIGDFAFSGTNLTSITIPNNVTTIGRSAFEQVPLTNVTFGNGLASIGSKAFKNTNLTNIVIPSTVTTIGNEAFKDIETLISLDYCWPDPLDPEAVLNGLEYVDLICETRTTIEVTSLDDSGVGTLSAAISQIALSDPDESFIIQLPVGIINLSDGLGEITRDTEIRGQGTSSVINLVDFGNNLSNKVLLKTNRSSVDLIVKNLVIQGNLLSGSLIKNQGGYIQFIDSTLVDLINSGSDALIENYADLNSRLYSLIQIKDTVFRNISGSRIFSSDYGYTPSTTLNDQDYNNRIYILGGTFDNVSNIAGVERFLKIENSIFKNSVSASISSNNNRFQLLNSIFESGISLNLSTAWDPLTGYSTRAGVQTSLSAREKVISGNTFKNISTQTPFVSLNTSSTNLGLLTFTNNDFQFTTNTFQKSPELLDVLNDAASYTLETIFSTNRYFYPSTIIFNGNGATSGSMANSTGVAIANLPSNQFIKAGFNFAGWNTQADGLGANYANLSSYTYGVDETLYATWTLIPISTDSINQENARLLEEKAKQARELQQLLTVLPSIGNLAFEIGKLIEKITIRKCVKGKKIKKVKFGAKCPKGYKVKK